jgi:hypothetical protein
MSTTPVPGPVPQRPVPNPNPVIWWILGVVGAGMVLLVAGSLVIAGIFVRGVHIREAGKKVEIETPIGSLKVNQGGTRPTGLPVYPGAGQDDSGGGSADISIGDETLVGAAGEKYFSQDALDKIADWYTDRLGSAFSRDEPGSNRHRINNVTTTDADVAFISDKGDMIRIVALKKRFDRVEISLARFGKREVQ